VSSQPQLAGQTVVVIGGSSGIGLETARRAHAEGAKVVITGRNKDRLHDVALELDAETAAFDALDFERLRLFFDELPTPIDHVLVSGSGPYYGPLSKFDFVSGTGGRSQAVGFTLISALTAATPALARNLALEIAPVRVNVIAAGFVDTPLSASLLGDQIEERREQLSRALPIGRVVGPADVAALAIHLMVNTAVTGATYDIDGGQQLIRT
jgi:NAD(P)-dependent dehydrogenase (short-subunit alcohol dehydrogenase family)